MHIRSSATDRIIFVLIIFDSWQATEACGGMAVNCQKMSECTHLFHCKENNKPFV